MKVYVTGGTGFIGKHLVNRLVSAGHEPVCLVRPTGKSGSLVEAGATLVTGDITDKASIQGMTGCDCVAHLASSFEFWVPDRKVYRDVNVIGLANVMEAALGAGVPKVLVVSTAAVYGNAPWPITEETPPGDYRPSEYAQTKYEGELLAWKMHRQKGLPLVMVYPVAVLGPNDPKAAGRYLRNMALGKMPSQVLVNRPFVFVHVQDVCEAIVAALEKEGNIGERYLVSAEKLTWGELNSLICEVAGSRPPVLKFPDWLTVMSASMLTALSRVTGKPPWLDLSIDQILLMKQGFVVDGSKAERELGLKYTPIRKAVEDAVKSLGIPIKAGQGVGLQA